MENYTFFSTLSHETQKAVADMGYTLPTPIQEAAIPPLLEGLDLIGQAQTGSGKTAAFGIPLVENIDVLDKNIQALVLAPTRELAVQITGELAKLGKYQKGFRPLAVYGGQPIERQLRELRYGAHIVVGTPGRVLDHISRGTLDLSKVKIVVLDEADEMLDMGFRDDIQTVLDSTPDERQTVLFSATMPKPIVILAKRYLKNPKMIEFARRDMTVAETAQSYIEVRGITKSELLMRFLDKYDLKLALVFLNTKAGVDDVVSILQAKGYSAAGLHGDMRQNERDNIMSRFRHGITKILVATDVAARGLDVENIEAVFNYDLPLDVEDYVHRIGRTGRAGRTGLAFTFVIGRDISRMWDYRRITGAKILCEKPPTRLEIEAIRAEKLIESVQKLSQGENMEWYHNFVEKLYETEIEPKQLMAALFKLAMGGGREEGHKPPVEEVIPAPTIEVVQPRPYRPYKSSNDSAPKRRTPYAGYAPRDDRPRGPHDVRDARHQGFVKRPAVDTRTAKSHSSRTTDKPWGRSKSTKSFGSDE